MTVTVKDILTRSVLAKADPIVEASPDTLDNTVRWAYTNERYDVARFLSGGELVIVEGSALFAHLEDHELAKYVDSLADIGTAGLVVELVEGLKDIPAALRARADERGLPVIGLRSRIPFVDACQSVNTLIVKDQFLVQMEVDALSTVLRRELAQADDVQDVGEHLSHICGESVAIYDADGLPIAQYGPTMDAGEAPVVLIPIERQGVPVATLELSQRVRLFDERARTQIAHVVGQVMAALMPRDASAAMTARVLSGPADGIHAGREEAGDIGQLLKALGAGDTASYYPFAVGVRSLTASAGRIERLLEGFASIEGAQTLCMLDGGVMFGLVHVDGGVCGRREEGVPTGLAWLSNQCDEVLAGAAAGAEGVWTIGGRAVAEAGMLADAIGVMRAWIRSGAPQWGMMHSVYDGLLPRFAHVGRTDEALAMLRGVMMGESLAADDALVRTLAACFETGDNKTRACERLGIQRQTLYNRLDKVTRLCGITSEDGVAWSLLLFAAQIEAETNGDAPGATW